MATRLKLCEVHSFSISPNSRHHTTVLNAIFLPQIIKTGPNLTKFWQKQICTDFFRHDVYSILAMASLNVTFRYSQLGLAPKYLNECISFTCKLLITTFTGPCLVSLSQAFITLLNFYSHCYTNRWRELQELIRWWDTRTWHRSILLPLLRLTPTAEGFRWDDLSKILLAFGYALQASYNHAFENLLVSSSRSKRQRNNLTDIISFQMRLQPTSCI